jgi:hypothetical protein
MHDTKLLSDSDLDGAAIIAQGSSTIRPAGRAPSRTNIWTVVGFCVTGLVLSLFVPAPYLHIEQSSTLTAEGPQS